MQRNPLPIGIFDSGTGGLTVLDSIIKIDRYNNKTKQPGPDGIPDFQDESFIYLGDKANMPYGRYEAEGKADFLRELVIKDVQFLLGNKYFMAPDAGTLKVDKEPVKAIVIACNTATAFGLDLAKKALEYWNLELPLLGIINAGSKSGIESLTGKEKQPIIGVMATQGTCSTQGYPRAIRKFAGSVGKIKVNVIQQAGFGLAAAIDGDLNYINPRAREVRGRERYFGPGLHHPQHTVDIKLWRQYNFSRKAGLLIKKDKKGKIIEVELNSVANYIKYHVTHLVINAANKFPEGKITIIILGCTHYPFFSKEIKDHFLYLKQLNKKYDLIIGEKLTIIDPANALAVQLHSHLSKHRLWGRTRNKQSQFFISVPNRGLKDAQIDKNGEFPFAYKYGRQTNRHVEFVKRIPFSQRILTAAILDRIKIKMPAIYNLIFPGQKFQ